MDDEISISFSVPRDEDGFLRRECPTCERQFKQWVSASDDEDDPSGSDADGVYVCPYCAVEAPRDAWFTTQQIEDAQALALREIFGPAVDQMKRSASRSNRSTGVIRIDVEASVPELPEPQAEDMTMTRVEFSCHPEQAVKVLDTWDRPVHCLMCGSSSAEASN